MNTKMILFAFGVKCGALGASGVLPGACALAFWVSPRAMPVRASRSLRSMLAVLHDEIVRIVHSSYILEN